MDAWSAANAPHRILVYRTVGWTYVVGGSKDQQAWRILKLSRREVELTVVEDPTTYTREELTSLLRCLRDGNQAAGGLQFVCRAHGMAGCFRFLQGYYLLLILKKSMQGLIAGHKVYGVESTALLPLLHPEAHAAAFREGGTALPEARYRRIFGGVPLDSSFLFSRTWPLWRSVQSVLAPGAPAAAPPPNPDPFASQWVWNAHISLPLRALDLARWLTPLVHGFWTQRRLSVFGRPFTLTLLARRSRRFAGTRYRKRGLNADGFVANEVELEQVVEAGLDRRTRLPAISSWLQLRGSLPLFWYQAASSAVLKPEIVVQQYDPLYRATAAHFDALRARYGDPVVALDLVRRSGREAALGRAYEAALAQLNRGWAREGRPGVAYVAWDMQAAAKRAPRTLLARLRRVQAPALDATGFFVLGGATGGWGSCARAAPDGGEGGAGERDSGAAAAAAPPSSPSLRLQSGVLRTNCIDCLDRTNLAQFAAGLSALGRQLAALGLSGSARGLAPDSSAARALMDAYEAAGHAAAQQYGGSEAHASFFQRARGDGAAATTSRDLLTSLRRFYSNAYTDADKQDSINLLLGVFRPEPGQPHLWELDSDSALHRGGRQGSLEGSVRAGRFVPRGHGADAGSLERLPQEGHRGLSAGVAPVPPTLAPLRGLGGGATAAPAPAAERGGQPGSILQPPLPTAGEESDTSGDECFTPSLLHLLSSASAEDSFAPSASVDLALAAGLAPDPAALLTQELGAASHPPEQAAVGSLGRAGSLGVLLGAGGPFAGPPADGGLPAGSLGRAASAAAALPALQTKTDHPGFPVAAGSGLSGLQGERSESNTTAAAAGGQAEGAAQPPAPPSPVLARAAPVALMAAAPRRPPKLESFDRLFSAPSAALHPVRLVAPAAAQQQPGLEAAAGGAVARVLPAWLSPRRVATPDLPDDAAGAGASDAAPARRPRAPSGSLSARTSPQASPTPPRRLVRSSSAGAGGAIAAWSPGGAWGGADASPPRAPAPLAGLRRGETAPEHHVLGLLARGEAGPGEGTAPAAPCPPPDYGNAGLAAAGVLEAWDALWAARPAAPPCGGHAAAAADLPGSRPADAPHGAARPHPALPLDLGQVLWGAEAVRHGLDSLGVSPGVAAWWAGDQLAVLVQQGLTLRAGLAQESERWRAPVPPPRDAAGGGAVARAVDAGLAPPRPLLA
ncbi:hypothetical protein ACKKBF_B10120 [Auxenochlorella protothecoides x Auxenochlorella symbiontica]